MSLLKELSHIKTHSPLQKKAAEDVLSMGFPTKLNEEWRYTSLKPLAELELSSAEKSKLEIKTKLTMKLLDAADVVSYFKEEFFDQLNMALPHKLLQIEIPSHGVEQVDLKSVVEKGEFFNTIIKFVLKSHSKLILNSNVEISGGFSNIKVIFEMEENSQCEVLNSHNLFSDSFSVSSFESYQKKHSTFRFVSLSKGADLLRKNISCHLIEEGASSEIYGFNSLKENLAVDCNIHSNHLAPHTMSKQFFKTILSENSKSVFQGRIFVEKCAQKTDAEQLSKSLMLSRKCTVDTKPQLDVYADDVKANHGAAIGQLDANEIFYLQSRGLSKEQSLNLLISAYGLEVVEKLQSEYLKDFAKKYLSGQGNLS